jgi:hypothetical protein
MIQHICPVRSRCVCENSGQHPVRDQLRRTRPPSRRKRRQVTDRSATDVAVDSSLIGSVTYGNDATLTIRFHSGAVYRYFTVPRTILEALLAAPSKGTYFNRHIRDAVPYQRVVDAPPRH